jgi:hypothetical protein
MMRKMQIASAVVCGLPRVYANVWPAIDSRSMRPSAIAGPRSTVMILIIAWVTHPRMKQFMNSPR